MTNPIAHIVVTLDRDSSNLLFLAISTDIPNMPAKKHALKNAATITTRCEWLSAKKELLHTLTTCQAIARGTD
jgi:hypothetical protein